MGPSSYMRSVVDRNVVTRRMTVLMFLIQSAKYENKLLAATCLFQLLSVRVCVYCNSSVAIIQLNCNFDSEIVWGFPRKIVEACKNVVTLGKTRHANTRVVTSKWINGPPTCESRETGRKTRHRILMPTQIYDLHIREWRATVCEQKSVDVLY